MGSSSFTPPTAPWGALWIDEAKAALSEAPPQERPACAARLAAMLFACGRDDEADAVLSQARRDAARAGDRPGMARIEIALAHGAVVRDNDARARGHLAAAARQMDPLPPSAAARAWLVSAQLARASGRAGPDDGGALGDAPFDATDPSERLDLDAELALERAMQARAAQEWPAARAHLAQARELAAFAASPRLAALADVEGGLAVAETLDAASGYAQVRAAIDALGAAGLRRDEGRAMIRLAEALAAGRAEALGESAARWLGRAQAALGVCATWRDRSAIRSGFTAHGRRVFDRALDERTAARIEAFERARGALLGAIAVAVEGAECALNDVDAALAHGGAEGRLPALVERVRTATLAVSAGTSPALGELDRVVHDLIDRIAAALVERDRLKSLLNALGDVDTATDLDSLPPLVARVTARILEADHVVVALSRHGSLESAGAWGDAPADSEDLWRSAAAAAARDRGRPSESPLSRRSDAVPAGPVLVVPLRASDVDGVIYADKLRRQGQFREQDHALACLLAEYSAIAIGRLRARGRERSALQRLAVTLDAIRDGVVAWDDDGVILSANLALERMLRARHDEIVGARIDQLPVLSPLWAMVAATRRLDGAVVRMTHGTFVVSTRPLGADDDASRIGTVATLVELDRAQKQAARIGVTRPRYGFHDIVGDSPALHEAVAIARQAAPIDATVLITGESGTGKEIIAQAIHTAGPRAAEPFVGINVAALPRELLEAELFGYERGAFTGARSEGNLGKFELAGGGTILLDEIGDMPLDMQTKLLRVLQERTVVRLGGSAERPVHARVLATTHRDLQQLVDEGKFRMDLLFRLRVLAIELPALRERRGDIPPLARAYLARFAEQQRKRVREIGPRVVDELVGYEWPGNIRELANVMEAEVSLLPADARVVERLATRLVGRYRGASLPPSTGETRAAPPAVLSPASPIVPLAELEKLAFLHALDKSGQSVARAAEALGVSKVTFYAKLRAWGLHPRDRYDEESPTSVRRQRAAAAPQARPSARYAKEAEPFEPPTRTAKLPSTPDD